MVGLKNINKIIEEKYKKLQDKIIYTYTYTNATISLYILINKYFLYLFDIHL